MERHPQCRRKHLRFLECLKLVMPITTPMSRPLTSPSSVPLMENALDKRALMDAAISIAMIVSQQWISHSSPATMAREAQSIPCHTLTPHPTLTPNPTPTPTITPDIPPAASINNIYGTNQALPLNCESSAAVDWAGYYGTYINDVTFHNELPLTDNPDTGFVGNVLRRVGPDSPQPLRRTC